MSSLYQNNKLQKQMDNNGWYQCDCCPYGYHIDLDFVRYCESIEQQADRTGSIKRRKDRRRQRKSMEVLLGLSVEEQPWVAQLPQIPQETNCGTSTVSDALQEVVSDFEQTLQRQRSTKLSSNLPDVTEVIRLPVSVSPAMQQDSTNMDPAWLSPTALQNIRQQMALSLQRTKQLEDEVKQIPVLQVQLDVLKEERRNLLIHLNHLEKKNNELTNETLSQPLVPPPPPPSPKTKTRDFSAMCAVLTRTVGCGNQYPHTRTVSTNVDHARKLTHNAEAQAQPEIKSIGISDHTTEEDKCKKCNVAKVSVASGSDADVTASKVVEAATANTPISLQTLMNAVPTRSRSFNLGEDKLKLVRSRSVSCQFKPELVNRDSQSEARHLSHKSSQCERKAIGHKAVQHEHRVAVTSTKSTDTAGLDRKRNVATSADVRQPTSDAATNTAAPAAPAASVSPPVAAKADEDAIPAAAVVVAAAAAPKKEDKKAIPSAESSAVSRIPRPAPLTPTEVRKFKRQDTYTKIPAPPPAATTPTSEFEPGLAGLDLSKEDTTSASSSLEKLKDNYKLPDVSSSSTATGAAPVPVAAASSAARPAVAVVVAVANGRLEADADPAAPREKKVPSKEMQAACKVLNDSLKKCSSANIKNQVRNATAIIRKEWFRVSGVVNADPLDVEDYLDYLEEVSAVLLQHIVNLMDESGNTAMHYAVSHGNFDVVSILLDSKVCNINQLNKVGYTSVMLVSLADVTSTSHATVVRRLFQMADVNVRALEHGQTALMLAVSHGRLDMVQMLLEAGADINIQDEDGSTALMCAAEHGHYEIVKHFLSQPDCDSSVTDVDGSTALKIAMEAGHRHIGVLLYAHERTKPSAAAVTVAVKQKTKKSNHVP